MNKKIFMLIALVSFSAQADVNFNCYVIKNRPVQTFAAGSLNCEKPTKTNVVTNGQAATDIVCMLPAICEPLSPNEKPTKLSDQQVELLSQPTIEAMTSLAGSAFKLSTLACKGSAQTANGNIVPFSAKCPAPSDCRKDVLFNTSFASEAQTADRVVSPQPEVNKNGSAR